MIIIAEGFEEIEAVAVIDLFRRAGIEIEVTGFNSATVKGGHGVVLKTDSVFDPASAGKFDLLVLPGGLKAVNVLAESEAILETVRVFDRDNKPICAICAAPVILDRAGILENRKYTAHPSVKNSINGGFYQKSRIFIDGNIVTSQGPGTAFEFALSIIEKIKNKTVADEISSASLIR